MHLPLILLSVHFVLAVAIVHSMLWHNLCIDKYKNKLEVM